ncbi:MAG: carbon-nitrogen hydrolase family protein [Bacilli bacterium]|nr:carbon-nitrogen hydrolase family protein [Bacilli bacterium]
MIIGLASYKFINNDIQYNISQIEKAINECNGKIDLLCFGETFLQGFDSLTWEYEKDKEIAVSKDSITIQIIKNLSIKYNIDIAFGYIEIEDEKLYSSYAVIVKGELVANYRRITKNWKEYSITDEHYQEGKQITTFEYKNQNLSIALCGDLWICPEKFKTNNLLLWPIYVNFTIDEWKIEEQKYAKQAQKVSNNVFMVNSLSEEPTSYGGSFYFKNGRIEQKLDYEIEKVLLVEA